MSNTLTEVDESVEIDTFDWYDEWDDDYDDGPDDMLPCGCCACCGCMCDDDWITARAEAEEGA